MDIASQVSADASAPLEVASEPADASAPALADESAPVSAASTAIADDAGSRVQALENEILQVKQRAVKKIRSLEDKLKSTTAELDGERGRAVSAAANWASQEHALRAEVVRLEAALEESAGRLDAALEESAPLQSQVSLQMQHELSLSQSLQVLQVAKEQQEEAYERELGALSRQVDLLHEERNAAAEAQATAEIEARELRNLLAEVRRASEAARLDAQARAEQVSAVDRLFLIASSDCLF